MKLTITNNSASNPQTVDLSPYVRVSPGEGMDVASPSFTQRVWTRSLLKEGATLALTQYTEKELQFPVHFGPIGGLGSSPQNLSQVETLIAQANMILETPGAVLTWQPDNASQPTYFDVLVGQVEVQYSYRKEQQSWTSALLRIFTQPFGRTAGPRAYAAASGVGPLLMITPYDTSGNQIIGQSTQAGVAGWGGAPRGASSGIFYSGAPSLAGDAQSLLQLTYLATPSGCHPSTSLVSLLPAPTYQPDQKIFTVLGGQVQAYAASVFGGSVYQFVAPASTTGAAFWMNPGAYNNGSQRAIPDQTWTGQHRVVVLARASGTWGQLYTFANSYVPNSTTASIQPSTEWGLYDLGTYTLRPSQFYSNATVGIGAALPSVAGVASNCAIDICGLFTLPDATTLFLGASSGAVIGNNNVVLIDDTLGEIDALFPWKEGAPSPANPQSIVGRLTPYTRGLPPRPDPKTGMPILAILAVGASSAAYPNRPLSAQVNVLERARYVFP